MTEKTPVAAYARVSTDRQRERHTIDSQLRLLPEYAKKQGWHIVDTFIDDGISGETIEERPGLTRLLLDVTQKRFEILLVVDEDRICRSKADSTGALIYDTLRSNNVKLATINGTLIDLSNENDDLYASLIRSFAKFEKQKILARTRRGRIERWRKGIPGWGKQPYGYDYDRNTRKFHVNEEHAAIVRSIFDMCANKGFGLDRIADELNKVGVQAPSVAAETGHRSKHGKWARSTVGKILCNECYCGKFQYNRTITKRIKGNVRVTGVRPREEWIPVTIPQIIDSELYRAAQNAKKQRKVLADRNKIREYLCGGLLRCAECGSKLCGEPSHGRTYYVCYNRKHRHRDNACKMPWISSQKLDTAVWSKIESVLRKPEILTDAIAHTEHRDTTDMFPSVDRLQYLIKMKGMEEHRALRLYTKSKVSEIQLDEMLANIKDERTILERNLVLVQERLQMAGKVQALRVPLQEYRRRLSQLSFSDKRKILRIFVDGSPGTGILVSRDSVQIVGIIPIANETAGARKNSPETWTLQSKLKQA